MISAGGLAALGLREAVGMADAGRVTALVRATGFFNAEEIAIAGELVDEHLRRGAASGYCFVFAEAGADLAGFACFGPVPATVSSWSLYWIAVAPGWQGRGLGRLLVGRVAEVVGRAGGERLYAETSTREQYAPSRAFYQHSGFALRATLPDHFAPGDGKAIYEKAIGR